MKAINPDYRAAYYSERIQQMKSKATSVTSQSLRDKLNAAVIEFEHIRSCPFRHSHYGAEQICPHFKKYLERF